MKKDLTALFNPKSIAVVGASQNLDSIGGRPLRYFKEHNFEGKVYPVNPKYDEMHGVKCYKSISDIEDQVDVALIIVNYKLVLPVLQECVQKGVKHAIVYSSGFSEAGEEGKKIQDQIQELAKESGMGILGPNCQGVVNLRTGNTSTFSASMEIRPLKQGNIGFVTQSGALGYSIFNSAQEKGVGFSAVVSTGNEADLESLDFLEYFIEDENTSAIMTYLEEVNDGKRFRELLERALKANKPVICLKVGSSEVGQKAAASHTASMVSSDTSYDTLFKQTGVIRVYSVEEMIDIAYLLEKINKMPKGDNLAIVTTSGGAGILLADRASDKDINVPSLGDKAQEEVEKYIPAFGSALNPVDVTAQVINEAENFKGVLNSLADAPEIDGIIVVISMIYGEAGKQMAKDTVEVFDKIDKPLTVTWPAGDRLMSDNFEVLDEGDVPWYKCPVRGLESLSKLMKYSKAKNKILNAKKDESNDFDPDIKESLKKAFSNNNSDKNLGESEGKKILKTCGLTVPEGGLCRDKDEAIKLSSSLKSPQVMKIDSPDVLHKSDIGAVKLNLDSPEEVEKAYNEIMKAVKENSPDAKVNGVLLEEMETGEKEEVIIGVKRDPKFGPMVMFGLGGVYVEVLKDVAFRFAPLTHSEALEMIKEIKSFKILEGTRGKNKKDIDALADQIVKVSKLASLYEEYIEELDINPLVVLDEGKGVKALDALLIKR
ncbi:acetate--CoA ligase family protein [Natranaerofaba carboxydovora]|uniref:acetate--CoA ligase family protein n=1 Tax=Natranaerofaba carboxydovora TaxID=2742683 RepID=UPI001F12D0CA|nr:acetate--CoA ligase family protein [Natranaerofaba carboxydovora]UMZ74802.1 ATP-grasp domain protein [Natranaerofaba carboxydovora]